jgi:hypothetical protein
MGRTGFDETRSVRDDVSAPNTGGGTDEFGKPLAGKASQVKTAQITTTPDQKLSTETRAAQQASQITGGATATAGQATVTQAGKAATYETTQAAPAVKTALEGTTTKKPLPTSKDAEDAMKIAVGRTATTPELLKKYDWNRDGKITSADALSLSKFAEGKATDTPMPDDMDWGREVTVGGLQGATGEVSKQAQVTAAQGAVSKEAIATAPTAPGAVQVTAPSDLALTEGQVAKAATVADVGGPAKSEAVTTGKTFAAEAAQLTGTPQAKAETGYVLPEVKYASMDAPTVLPAAKAAEIPSATSQQTTATSTAIAQQRAVTQQELVDVAKQGLQLEAVQAVAATMDTLNSAAVATAQQGSFSQSLATAQTGTVEAASTVAGQMDKLMQQFNDGTPAWAAGAMRAANAAMASRGLGASSMAGAAIVQAAMESAVPIAAADAQTFAQMGLTNLNNRQQVSLANAAALQNMDLANLNNRQQAALQNSANSFTLQSQNLSNQQSVVLANAQLKAAAQEKNLDAKWKFDTKC